MSKHIINDLNDTGFFTFELIQKILDCKKDITTAKEIALNAVKNYPRNATRENTIKAIKLIEEAKSVTGLAMQMGNFILSYQGMKVVK